MQNGTQNRLLSLAFTKMSDSLNLRADIAYGFGEALFGYGLPVPCTFHDYLFENKKVDLIFKNA